MKSSLLLTVLLLVPFAAFAQHSAVFAEKMNVFYIGVANPIKIAVEKYDCRDVAIMIEGANITPTDICSFNVFVEKPGITLVKVIVKDGANTKTVSEYPFRMKYIPDPVAKIAGKPWGMMTVDVFRFADSISTQVNCFDFDATFVVTGFNIAVSKNDKEAFTSKTQGNKFDNATRQYFNSLTSGDKVLITDVHVIGPDKIDRQLEDMTFTLK